MTDLLKAGLCRSTTYQVVNRCDLPEGHEGVHRNQAQGGWWERGAKNACESAISDLREAAELRAAEPQEARCPGCRSRRKGACPGCKKDVAEWRNTSNESSSDFIEPKFVWRRSLSDFATDVVSELGPMVAVAIADELASRAGVEVIARDREAALVWVYGKSSAEMGRVYHDYVSRGTYTLGMPAFLNRLARSFAEVRFEKEMP